MNDPRDPTRPTGGRPDPGATCTTGKRGYPTHQAAWRMLSRRGPGFRHPAAMTYQCEVCRQIHVHSAAKYRDPSKRREYPRNQLRRELRAELLQALRWYITTDAHRLPIAVRVNIGGPQAIACSGTL